MAPVLSARPLIKCLRRSVSLLLLSPMTVMAFANSFQWTAPSSAELSMTSDPKAPGAPAIVLSYLEVDDADSAEVMVHVRIKVLTDAGRDAGNIEAPARIVMNDEFKQDFFARTIHPDGSVVVYVPNATNSHISKVAGRDDVRTAALSEVTVGSIVEYGYHFNGQNTIYTHLIGFYYPTWNIQQQYFVRAAHYSLKTPDGLEATDTRWISNLPADAHLDRSKNRIELDVVNVPARPNEDLLPPLTSIAYNVRFFFWDKPRGRFWGETGADVDDRWFEYYRPRKALKDVVHDLILPTDSDEVKLHKIYDAVQKFENTDLTRARTIREDKQAGISEAKNSEDVWNRKRGDSEELTLLFIALARSAGYEAYPMQVASRSHAIFSQDVLSWSQMDSMVAIVLVNGHEVYFDPGTRRCPFAHLAPWHSNVVGVSTEAKLVKIRSTPTTLPGDNRTDRIADLTIDASGAVTGSIQMGWYGNAALDLRRQAVSEDEVAVRAAIEHGLQAAVPDGIEVKLDTIKALAESDVPLIAKYTVTGRMGVATAKRLILPAEFFASTGKPVLASETRVAPVAFPAAYLARDQMTLHLPSSLAVETMPVAHSLKLGPDSEYSVRIQAPSASQNLIVMQRFFTLTRVDYKLESYSALHTYFGQVATFDQDQIVLQSASAGSAGN